MLINGINTPFSHRIIAYNYIYNTSLCSTNNVFNIAVNNNYTSLIAIFD